MKIQFGIDRLLGERSWPPGRIGLVTNDAARTAADPGLHSRLALQRAGCQVVRLFSPEHGLHAKAPDGAAVTDALDPLTGLPVVSLYGDTMRPPPELLRDLDAVLFDIPDIGARFYTYIWTLSHLLEACAGSGTRFVVLDRPNPLGGDLSAAEGPFLDAEKFGSFIGRAAIPIRHSLTAGELARLWNVEWRLNADLQVTSCAGWQRAMHWPDTGLPFVQTSPAMTSYESALCYPGLCLFEATNLSVGRGTTQPFQIIGAPWLDAETVAAAFNGSGLSGVMAEPIGFSPEADRFAGQPCRGVRLRVSNTRAFRPVASGLHLLVAVIETHSRHFAWTGYPTAANPTGAGHFERLIGQAGIREMLESDPKGALQHIAQWTEVPGWHHRVKQHQLYF